jgi:hypothetical protein
MPFSIVYDLRDRAAWTKAHRDRSYWGKLYTDLCILENNHVALVFRPAPDSRWRAWEGVRRGWILKEAP